MIDLSINFLLSEKLRKKVLILQNNLQRIDRNQNFVPELKLHCTVKSCGLLGEQINEKVIPEVIRRTKELLNGTESFKVQLKGVQTFQNIVFIKVISKDSKLIKLHNLLNSNIPYSEYPELEGMGYKPHTTIIELNLPSSEFLAELKRYNNYDCGTMKVSKINIILGGEASSKNKFKVLKSLKLMTKSK